MRRLRVALPVVVLIVVAAASGRRAASVPEARATFRVATYNIHKGASRQGPYDLERTVEAISRLDADLVGVQEAMRNHPGANCDDQPRLIAEGLRRRTGRSWKYVYAKAWIGDNRECQRHGRGDGVETEGLAFFAAERIVSWHSTPLPEGRVALAVRVASMPRLEVIVSHLAANRQNQPHRIRQIEALLPWAEQHGPSILVGDLNAEPDARELAPVLARYRDGWAEAAARGDARGIASGSTRPNRVARIDYVFYAPGTGLTLESAEAIDTSTLGLGEVSDHNPVVATFRRK